MGVLFEKWRYGFEILVQKPGYSVLAIEKNCNKVIKICLIILSAFIIIKFGPPMSLF